MLSGRSHKVEIVTVLVSLARDGSLTTQYAMWSLLSSQRESLAVDGFGRIDTSIGPISNDLLLRRLLSACTSLFVIVAFRELGHLLQ